MEKQSTTFTFINLSEPKQGKDEDLRKFVRSNAMRSYRRKQKQKAVNFHMQKGPSTAPPQEKDRPRLSPDASKQLEPSQLSQLQNARSDWPEDWDMSLLEAQQLLLPGSESIAERDDQDHDYLLFTHCGDPFTARPKLALSSSKLFGDGLNDPFNAYPIGGCPRYNSYVLDHFVSVMTKDCLPIDPGNGQNPLTKVWVPYAMTDPVLFLATLNFAAVHLDLLRGTQSNHKTLIHKGETIRRINARLQSSTETVSNTTIGAVAMLAAMESMSGNCKDLRIHMDALAQMVKMRGGLQGLGWSGVLHMFISWQDLISSAMMASPPHFPRTPCCLVINGDLPYSNLAQVSAYIDNTTELCGEMETIFQNMRYLADSLGTWGRSITMNDLMSFSKQRSTLEHRLLSMKIRKPKAEMRNLDYLLEACRLSALIFVKCVLHNFKPVCAILRNLKEQLINLAPEVEDSIIEDRRPLRRSTITWILFMGGILSLNSTEEDFFAERIAKSTEAWHREGMNGWADMEMWLKDIAWVDSLRTPECISLWNRAQTLSGKGPGGVDPCTVPVHRCFSC